MKPSVFIICLAIAVVGVIWIGYVFSDVQRISEDIELGIAQTQSVELNLKGNDIGFYKISLPSLGDTVFAQILNPQNSIISDKKIETKSAINYFDFKNGGTYTVKITNLTEHSIVINVEFGQLNVNEMIYPGILILLGCIGMVFASFRKLFNYKIAQPEENIS